jgi:hypothetical protein
VAEAFDFDVLNTIHQRLPRANRTPKMAHTVAHLNAGRQPIDLSAETRALMVSAVPLGL